LGHLPHGMLSFSRLRTKCRFDFLWEHGIDCDAEMEQGRTSNVMVRKKCFRRGD
jgi:hypothetical protein